MFVPPTLFFFKIEKVELGLAKLACNAHAFGSAGGGGRALWPRYSDFTSIFSATLIQNILLYFAALFDSCIENSTNN